MKESKTVNPAELLTFSKHTYKFINSLFQSEPNKEDLKKNLKILNYTIKKKIEKLIIGDKIPFINNLEFNINEYYEQKKIKKFTISYFKEINNFKFNLEVLNNFCKNYTLYLQNSDLSLNLKIYNFLLLINNFNKFIAIDFIRENNIPEYKIKKYLYLLISTKMNELRFEIKSIQKEILNEYKRVLLNIKGVPEQTRLFNRVYYGLSALITTECSKGNDNENNNDKDYISINENNISIDQDNIHIDKDNNNISINENNIPIEINKSIDINPCITCIPWIYNYAKNLKIQTRPNSFIICTGLGKEIKENNYPLLYDSNYVYSKEYYKKCGNVIYCKRMKRFYMSVPRKVYFL